MKPTLLIILTALFISFNTQGQNPVIQACIAEVSADSIRATMEYLQAYGTRYCLANNRKDIAEWIRGRFQQYGYTDVILDSLQASTGDSAYWQYNVVCSLTGSDAPDEVCILGGHYDSYSTDNLLTQAPGADDNASAVAATLEIARVMKLLNYHPTSTIRFILFAGEEMGYWGSKFQAEKSKETGEDIRFVFNMDMISYNPDSLNQVYLFRYQGAESAFNLAAGAFQQYTGLAVSTGPADFLFRSDSYVYWQHGFQTTWAFEYDFNDYYHSANDVVSNCNLAYCAEVTMGVMAGMLEMQYRPYPQRLKAHSSKDNIKLSWKPTGNNHFAGYRVYRSEQKETGFEPINVLPLNDTTYVDAAAESRKDYFYRVTLLNDLQQESVPSATVTGTKFSFTDTLLVVACMKAEQTTPDSIRNFNASILDSIPFRWFDMNSINQLTLGTLSAYRNTLWVINSMNYDKIPDQVLEDLETFFANNGNMMFAGFSFTRFILGNIGFPIKIPDASFVRDYFRVDSTDKKINSYMFLAFPDNEEYDTLRMDTAKSMKPGYPGELYNIEVFVPENDGIPVYRFGSKHDPGTPEEAQQGKIVGIENIREDYKTILLSFPLYYLDTADARSLVNYVIKNKFANPLAIEQYENTRNLSVKAFPNPAFDQTRLSFFIPEPSHVQLNIYNAQGKLIRQLINRKLEQGEHTLIFLVRDLPTGIYFYRLLSGNQASGGKIIVVR